jgi:hypothetical protein
MRRLLRHCALILVVLACIVFIGVLVAQFLLLTEMQRQAQASNFGTYVPSTWTMVISALSNAFSGAAIPFLGACAIDRVDRYLALKEPAK